VKEGELEYAGFWLRAGAWLLDTLYLTTFITFCHLLIFGNAGFSLESAPGGGWEVKSNGFGYYDDLFMMGVTVAMWVRFYGTPGKLLLDCYVVDQETGQSVTWGKSLLRYLCYFISALPVGLGFLWVLWDKKKQGFHDKIAKTLVVRKPPVVRDDESVKTLKQLVEEVR